MKNTEARPYANTRLAKFVERRILELKAKKTQSTIANEAGFSQHNMLTNIKLGNSKLPLDRVPALAKALEVDPALLFMMAVEQLGGDTTELAIRKIFGTLVTENETAWLEEIRKASNHSDPSLTSRARAALRGIFGK
ncbi:XRE family transcriptional regulator [Mesorhizobium opportunistum]|uniref:XRE family transcriptional regulator n=1 Tax=Mesorhizobium opportunistum TaxID=593909 RepID=UPI003335FAE2